MITLKCSYFLIRRYFCSVKVLIFLRKHKYDLCLRLFYFTTSNMISLQIISKNHLIFMTSGCMFLKVMDVILTSSCFIQLVGARSIGGNTTGTSFSIFMSPFEKVKTSFWMCESNLRGNFSSRNFWLNLRWIPELLIIRDMLTTKNHKLPRIAFCFQLIHLGQDY